MDVILQNFVNRIDGLFQNLKQDNAEKIKSIGGILQKLKQDNAKKNKIIRRYYIVINCIYILIFGVFIILLSLIMIQSLGLLK